MTTTYSPDDPAYLDEDDLRVELGRVFDLCHGCRLCFNLCPSFPTMFDLVDANDGDVSALTAADQDRVVDECYQCKLCYPKCPYVPPHEWQLDFPRLMMRAHAVRHAQGRPARERVTDQALARTDLMGRVSTAAAPLVNALTGTPGSWTRRLMERTAGMAAERLLPPYARDPVLDLVPAPAAGRGSGVAASTQGEVSVFPTCFIEYMEPAIGQDLVKVYERNDVSCSLPEGTRCCGAPWLHQGNVAEFTRAADPQRRRPGRRGAVRQGGGRRPAHLCLRRPEGLPALPGGHPAGRRRASGGRAHRRIRPSTWSRCTGGRGRPSTPISAAVPPAPSPTR